jgi:hypothetical protein
MEILCGGKERVSELRESFCVPGLCVTECLFSRLLVSPRLSPGPTRTTERVSQADKLGSHDSRREVQGLLRNVEF